MKSDGLIGKRKFDHIKICSEHPLELITYTQRKTLLECIELLPSDFPQKSPEEIETKTQFLSTTINAPIMVSAITGGTDEGEKFNRTIASICQSIGIPFAFGSGRIMIDDPSTAKSFYVRDLAPDIPLIANIGIAQAEEVPTSKLKWLVEELEADSLAIHVNFAMETFQPEGNRKPASVFDTIARIKEEVNFPIIVKEVGTGFTPGQLEILRQTGADWVDVAGSGGTNWLKIEVLRANEENKKTAEPFLEWGFPTAATLLWAVRTGHEKIIASGGITNGFEVAKAMVLGAKVCGIALPVLRIFYNSGQEGVKNYLQRVINQIKICCSLCAISNVKQFSNVPYLIKGELKEWMELHR